jgi:hypothetical protein
MPQFMLLLAERPGEYASLSPEQIQKVLGQFNAWTGKVAGAGKLVGGHKLTEAAGKRLVAKGGGVSVTDGPYAETKEVIGGYFIVKAADYDEAVKIASDCPALPYGYIDVRQVDFMGQPES